MRDCENVEIREQLPELAAGRLEGEALETVEAHLRSCADCAEEIALLRSARALLRRGAPAIDAGSVAHGVLLETTPVRVPTLAVRPGRRVPRWPVVASIAAGLLALAVTRGARDEPVQTAGSGALVNTPTDDSAGAAGSGAFAITGSRTRQAGADSTTSASRTAPGAFPPVAPSLSVAGITDEATDAEAADLLDGLEDAYSDFAETLESDPIGETLELEESR